MHPLYPREIGEVNWLPRRLVKLLVETFQGTAMGMMDGTITILGIIMGVGAATGDARLIVISGLIGGLANSIGTSVGFYTSEHAERGQQIEFYEKKRKKAKDKDKYIHSKSEIYLSTCFSFLAAIVALLLPISPFFFGMETGQAMVACFAIAIIMLFLLGTYIGRLNKENEVKNGFKYAVIGVASAFVAFGLGEVLKNLLF
jgi:predicted membrane protein (TIGR00267 family)